MEDRVTCIQVSKDTRFVNVGIDIDGELEFFRIAIIDVMGIVGMLVVNPDGDLATSSVTEDVEIVSTKFTFMDILYNIELMPSDLAYELRVTQKAWRG
jgi:hypothetical protein